MSDFDNAREIVITVTSAKQLAAVYALLGGAPVPALISGNAGAASAKQVIAAATEQPNTQEGPASDGPGPSAATDASLSDDGVVDAGGWPWSADLHASTKGVTKEGLWRMKVGVARPDPKPGFPIGVTGTANAGEASKAAASAAPAPAGSDDDDEFAAFRDAAANSDAADAAAKAKVPARKWTDADLGALCNQAAVKLGDPAPVKAIIAAFAAEGETPHSRNVPEDKRAEFAAAVEAKAGIEFAG